MAARVEYRDLGLNQILKNLGKLANTSLRVGVVGPKASQRSIDGRLTNAEVALINEYGSRDKHVPARSFLREPFRANPRAVVRAFGGITRSVALLRADPTTAINKAGQELAQIIKQGIEKSGIFKSNAPDTIKKKGFAHPLVWSHRLVDAISYQVIRSGFGLATKLDFE